jgi:hypothetical protein
MDYFEDFQPKTFEFILKKHKLGIKYHLSVWNVKETKNALDRFSIEIENFKNWKILNEIPDECLSNEKLDSSINFLKSKLFLVENELENASKCLDMIKMNEEKLMIVKIPIDFSRLGLKETLSFWEKFIFSEGKKGFD